MDEKNQNRDVTDSSVEAQQAFDTGPQRGWVGIAVAPLLVLIIGIGGSLYQSSQASPPVDTESQPPIPAGIPLTVKSEPQPGTNSAPTGGRIEGFSANWFIAKQAEKNRELMALIRRATQSNDLASALSALRIRRNELAKAIIEIEEGNYSLSDKVRMKKPVVEESDWVSESILGLMMAQ